MKRAVIRRLRPLSHLGTVITFAGDPVVSFQSKGHRFSRYGIAKPAIPKLYKDFEMQSKKEIFSNDSE